MKPSPEKTTEDKTLTEHAAYFGGKFAISNSSLKDWKDMSPQEWYETWYSKTRKRKVSRATSLGSYVDCLMFTPYETEKRFLVAEIKLPSEKVQLIIDSMIEHVDGLNKNVIELKKKDPKLKVVLKEPSLEDKELIMSLCVKYEHFTKTPERAYEDVLKKGTEYFEFLQSVKGREVVTKETREVALEIQKILLTDKVSKPFFVPKAGCEVLHQVRIFGEFELVGFDNLEFLPVKGAVDTLHFNHNTKQVREVDLKVTNDAFMFREAIKRFGYVRQHSFYDFLIKEWLKTYKDGIYAEYTVMPPLNLVIDDVAKVPYIYQYSDTDLYIERYGVENSSFMKGWETTIYEIAQHFELNNWQRPIEHIKNGFIHVNWYKR